MGFYDYANQTQSNIIPQKEFEELVKEVFDVIATNLSKSLGPLGSSATILDGMMTDATKDGYAILQKYRFHNRYKKMIYNLIKAPCTVMNNTVGDGTTTAIALTNALFSKYEEKKNVMSSFYRLPRTFVEVWDDCIKTVCEEIQKKSKPINPRDYDTIYNIAYVTSNGNHEISDAVAKIYQECDSPSIKEKASPTNKCYVENINGFEFSGRLIDTAFVRNEDMSVEEDDINVMIFGFRIETDFFTNVIQKINEIKRAQGKKLLIIAPAYDNLMCDTVVEQYLKYEFSKYGSNNFMLLQYRSSDLKEKTLHDLSVILNCKVVSQLLGPIVLDHFTNTNADSLVDSIENDDQCDIYNIIGECKHAFLSCNNGSIFTVDEKIVESERYKTTLAEAKANLEDIINGIEKERQSYSAKIYEAKTRITQLEMKNYIYYIGADSALQKNIIWDAVEDVIKCLRSAIQYGVVPGCQILIPEICHQLVSKVIGLEGVDDIYVDNGEEIQKKIEENMNKLPDKDKLRIEIYELITDAVTDVYWKILIGPNNTGLIKLMPRWQFTTKEGISDLVKEANEFGYRTMVESFRTGKVFDIESGEFSDKIITSAETDRMVLSVASDLVKILISGNQCIVLDSDVDGSHEEVKEVYV